MTVYLLQYNNYYNRLVKAENSLTAYQQYIVNTLQATNFKPNDYINAEIIIPLTGNIKTNWINGDYVLVVDGTNTIVSRWFVTESVRLTNAQHRLSLRRDVIADYYNVIKGSPIFVEKATLDSGNPLVFNNENMTYNQIKVKQEDLYDESGNAWIAMYVGLDALKNEQGSYTDTDFDFTTTNLESIMTKAELLALTGGIAGNIYNNNAELKIIEKEGSSIYTKATKYSVSGQYSVKNNTEGATAAFVISASDRPKIASAVQNHNFSNYDVTNRVPDAIKYNGIIVKDNNKYYKVVVNQTPRTVTTQFHWSSQLGAEIRNATGKNTPSSDDLGNKLSVSILEQQLVFEETVAYTTTLTTKIKTTTVYCNEAPYYLFYLPYTPGNLNLAIGLTKRLGSFCYDVQVVPYCPEERNRKEVEYRDTTESNITIPIKNKSNGTIVGYLYSAASNSFSFDLQHRILAKTESGIELKIQNETEFIRLNSPNGQGSFEMSVAKNYGLDVIHVECSYKPISPYINICPQFKGLYGSDFKDFRGLICQGDFSIPLVNDAWVAYEQNNKNYQNIFDREIESMELKNKVGIIQDITGAVSGTLQGVGAGALVGGAPGAIAGGVGSAAAGVADVVINQKLRTDALDLTKDQFGYNLGNIKARPNTLSKTGAISIDNHYVPYIEFYDCTETEKQALRNKIKYNGMTVGVIGTISEYLNDDYTYIKGKLIRLEGVYDDTHLLNTIADELYKGVYVK